MENGKINNQIKWQQGGEETACVLLLYKADSLFALPVVFISEAEAVDTKLEADIKGKQVFAADTTVLAAAPG